MSNNMVYNNFDQELLGLSAVLLILGELLSLLAGYFHPSQEPANNHVAVLLNMPTALIGPRFISDSSRGCWLSLPDFSSCSWR